MISLTGIGRWLVFIGLALIVIGGVLWALGKLPFLYRLGRLPGDIYYQSQDKRVTIAFPMVTSLLISLILTVILNVVARLLRK